MTKIRSWFLLFGFLALSGCSTTSSLRLPWQAAEKQSQDQPLDEGKSDLASQKLPLIVELVDSGFSPVGKKDLSSCSESLGMLPEKLALAHPSNYGDRDASDAWGRSLQSGPQLIVLHETVISGPQTVAFFQTNHPEDDQQASYHLLIDRDGSRIRVVPDEKRAYGAGMSAFGDVTQRAKPASVGSINNIGLHVSLVSPADGRDDRDGHSGYTDAQYKTLAGQVLLWQAAFGIPMTRVTTHAAVDRSHSRYDPRSFRWNRFDPHYRAAVAACGFSQFDNGQAGL